LRTDFEAYGGGRLTTCLLESVIMAASFQFTWFRVHPENAIAARIIHIGKFLLMKLLLVSILN